LSSVPGESDKTSVRFKEIVQHIRCHCLRH